MEVLRIENSSRIRRPPKDRWFIEPWKYSRMICAEQSFWTKIGSNSDKSLVVVVARVGKFDRYSGRKPNGSLQTLRAAHRALYWTRGKDHSPGYRNLLGDFVRRRHCVVGRAHVAAPVCPVFAPRDRSCPRADPAHFAGGRRNRLLADGRALIVAAPGTALSLMGPPSGAARSSRGRASRARFRGAFFGSRRREVHRTRQDVPRRSR